MGHEERLYKLTLPDGSPPIQGADAGLWSLPQNGASGEWREVSGELVACKNGLHLLRARDIREWVRWPASLFEAEYEGERLDSENKVVVRRARLIRIVPGYTRDGIVRWGCDCAERVLPIFETRYPKDERPRKAIFAARKAIAEPTEENRAANAAADYAANAAAYAANAAANAAADYAAYAAARAAANDAAYAAYDAANAAANAAAYAADAAYAEREWQSRRLCELIGVEWQT